jgi:hypothetical protein
MASIDAYDGNRAAREAERAIRDLGLRGLFVDCARSDLLIDAPQARPALRSRLRRGLAFPSSSIRRATPELWGLMALSVQPHPAFASKKPALATCEGLHPSCREPPRARVSHVRYRGQPRRDMLRLHSSEFDRILHDTCEQGQFREKARGTALEITTISVGDRDQHSIAKVCR